jgi:hypothetical protein
MAGPFDHFALPWGGPENEAARLVTEPAPAEPELPPVKAANPCFAAGTRILTERGDTPVEDLAPGDFAVTAENELAQVIWIGRRDVDLAKHPAPGQIRPVRVAAGALAMGVPERELVLSPDHALYFDGSLVQVRDLIDGIAIRQDFEVAAVRYYHVELERHAVLLAEGAGAESFLDSGQRAVFSSASARPEGAGRRAAESVAPLVTGGEQLAAIRARLHARKLMLGIFVAEAPYFALKFLSGELLFPAENVPGRVSFALPAGVSEAVFCSPVFIPAELDPASMDRRRVGAAIADVFVDGRLTALERVFVAADLHRRAPRETATWTRGAARLKIPAGATSISFHIAAPPRYWRRGSGV